MDNQEQRQQPILFGGGVSGTPLINNSVGILCIWHNPYCLKISHTLMAEDGEIKLVLTQKVVCGLLEETSSKDLPLKGSCTLQQQLAWKDTALSTTAEQHGCCGIMAFWSAMWPTPQEKTHGRYCRSGQGLWLWGLLSPELNLISQYSIKLLSK